MIFNSPKKTTLKPFKNLRLKYAVLFYLTDCENKTKTNKLLIKNGKKSEFILNENRYT